MSAHAPQVSDIRNNPSKLVVAGWLIGLGCFVISLGLFYLQRRRLNSYLTPLKNSYLVLSSIGVVFSFLSFVGLVFLREGHLFNLLRYGYLAFCIQRMYALIMHIVGTDENGLMKLIESNGVDKQAFLFIFPYSDYLFRFCVLLVNQACMLLIVCAFGMIWVQIDATAGHSAEISLAAIATVSMALGMYGFFYQISLIRLTLSSYRIYGKFLYMFALAIICTLQPLIIYAAVADDNSINDDYDAESRRLLIHGIMSAIEGVILSNASFYDFNSDELELFEDETKHRLNLYLIGQDAFGANKDSIELPSVTSPLV